MAKRGSNEVASCLFHFFNNFLPEEVETLFLYSDGCGGQNNHYSLSLFSCRFKKMFKKKYTIYSPFVVIASCLVIVTLHLSNSGSVKLKLFTFQINGSLSLKILGFITSLMLCE